MEPANYTIEIDKGAGWQKTFEVYDDNGALQDTTGWTACLQIRDSGTNVLYLDLRTGSGGTVGCSISMGGPAGTISLSIDYTQTAAITWKSASYDMFIIPGVGQQPQKYLVGTAKANERITQWP